jgi:hypothetical protein
MRQSAPSHAIRITRDMRSKPLWNGTPGVYERSGPAPNHAYDAYDDQGALQ